MSGTLPSAEEWAARCGLTRRGREWVGPCPSCGGTDRFHVTDREGTARWGCRGCIDNRQDGEKQAATRAVLEAAFPNREGHRAEAASRRPAPAAGSATGSAAAPGRGEPADERRRAYAARAWASAIPVPAEEGHPARRWLWGRGKPLPGPALWPPGEPLPGGVRWLPEFPADGWPYGGRPPRYGAVAVLLAPPRDWFAARPGLPTACAIQACLVDGGGAPASPWGRESPNEAHARRRSRGRLADRARRAGRGTPRLRRARRRARARGTPPELDRPRCAGHGRARTRRAGRRVRPRRRLVCRPHLHRP